jgi:hypothetical protein
MLELSKEYRRLRFFAKRLALPLGNGIRLRPTKSIAQGLFLESSRTGRFKGTQVLGT